MSLSDLSIFTPLLTVVSLVIIYPFFKKDKKKYKKGENIGLTIIKLGNKVIHKEKLYIK